MKSYLSIFLLLVFLTVSCSKKESIEEPIDEETTEEEEVIEEPKNEVYFTLVVDELIDTSTTDDWLIIQDNTGVIIDAKSFESGTTLSFESQSDSISDQLILTMLKYSTFFGTDRYDLETYDKIEKNSKWIIKELLEPDFPNSTGDFNLILANIPNEVDANRLNISTTKRNASNSSETQNNGLSTTVISKVQTFDEEDQNRYFLSIPNQETGYKYMFFDKQENGTTLNLDYNDLVDYSIDFIINLPQPYFYRYALYGLNNEQDFNNQLGFLLNFETISDSPSGIKSNKIELGYLNLFDKYITDVVIQTNYGSYRVREYGEKPKGIINPESSSLTIENSSIIDFNFTTNIEALRSVNYFLGATQGENPSATYWNIYSSGLDFPKLDKLPEEIKLKYPNLTLPTITHLRSDFYIQSNSYEEFISTKFINPKREVFSYELARFQE